MVRDDALLVTAGTCYVIGCFFLFAAFLQSDGMLALVSVLLSLLGFVMWREAR